MRHVQSCSWNLFKEWSELYGEKSEFRNPLFIDDALFVARHCFQKTTLFPLEKDQEQGKNGAEWEWYSGKELNPLLIFFF